MRIGIHLTPTGDTKVGDLQAQAAGAAGHGFDAAWTNQQPGGWDPLAVLAVMDDGPPELGTAIVPTYPRHPVVLATEALTAQALTGGRLTLGIGPSHAMYVRDQLGLSYAAPARHTREYLEVLRPLLHGEHVRHAGAFFTVDTRLEMTAPAPPVLISALGPRMLETARDLADGTVAVWVRPDTVSGYLVPRLGDGARVAVMVSVSVTADPDGVRGAIAQKFAHVGELPAYRVMLDRGGLTGPADTVVAGGEDVVRRELGRFRDAGVTDLIVTPVGSAAERERTLEVAAPPT